MLALRSLLFSCGFLLASLFFGILALFIFFLSYKKRYAMLSRFAQFSLWWLKITCQLHYSVEGLEYLNEGPPAIVFCRHQSTWETLVLQRIFLAPTWVLKRELLRIPFFGWGLKMLEPISINRSKGKQALRQLLKEGKERLAQQRWIVIFPEGTRVKTGESKAYHIGGAFLAEKSGYCVIPVTHNAGEFWVKGQFIKRPGTIRVRIGKPIDPQGKKIAEINDLAKQWIESTTNP